MAALVQRAKLLLSLRGVVLAQKARLAGISVEGYDRVLCVFVPDKSSSLTLGH